MARKCLEQIFSKGYKYHKAGIILLDLVPVTFKQLELFDSMDTPERSRLMQTIDKMNTVMGRDTMRFGSQGISHPWARRCEHRTPRYTTSWEELVKVT
jgi:DNA polymerase V